MPRDLNQCNFIGRVGKPLELKYAPSGNAVVNFSIACSDDYKDKSGQKVEQTNWINLVIWGKLAEIAAQYLNKGSKIYVSGKQITRKWQDQSGADRYTTEIVVSEMQMLGGRNDSGGQNSNNGNSGANQQNQQQQQRPANQSNAPQSQPQNTDRGFEDFDDDIPF